jgi:hypothetical protein
MTTDGKGNRTCNGATPDDLLKRAAKIRRHAWHLVDDPIAEHLEKYADELEARAARLARE